MNFLSIFVLIPLLMLAGLWAARGIKAIRGVVIWFKAPHSYTDRKSVV